MLIFSCYNLALTVLGSSLLQCFYHDSTFLVAGFTVPLLAVSSSSTTRRRRRPQFPTVVSGPVGTVLHAVDDDDDAVVPERKRTYTPAELVELEEESSRRVRERLLLPDRIGGAVTKVGWSFVALGILLNTQGYGFYVREDNHLIAIDTMENVKFQREKMKKVTPPVQRQQQRVAGGGTMTGTKKTVD